MVEDERCYRELSFRENIARITEILLALSLYHSLDELHVPSYFIWYSSRLDSFGGAVSNILETENATHCLIKCLSESARALVGHIDSIHGPDFMADILVLSSSKGQAVWPAIYQDYQIRKSGILSYYWLPGSVFYNQDAHEAVRTRPHSGSHISIPVSTEPVIKPRDLCPPDWRLVWSIGPAASMKCRPYPLPNCLIHT